MKTSKAVFVIMVGILLIFLFFNGFSKNKQETILEKHLDLLSDIETTSISQINRVVAYVGKLDNVIPYFEMNCQDAPIGNQLYYDYNNRNELLYDQDNIQLYSTKKEDGIVGKYELIEVNIYFSSDASLEDITNYLPTFKQLFE